MTQHDNTSRPGRWRSGAESKQRILRVARELFHEHGYGSTTVRAIATAEGVDPAMVFYFFGTKQGLFGAGTDMSGDVPPAIQAIFAGAPAPIGERIVRTRVEILDKSGHLPLV